MKFSYYILALIIVISLQITDYKVYDIKIGDFFSLFYILYIICNIKIIKITKFYKNLYLCFWGFLLSSFVVMLWVEFFPPSSDLGFLKQIGIISISRFIQLIGCLSFSLIIHNIIINKTVEFTRIFLRIVDRFMFLMFIFYFLFFILSFFEFDSPFVYNGHRLRGAYVEGGPFGLFVAFYFLLSLYVLGLNKKKLFLTLCLIFASQSKSAIVFLFFVGVSYFLLNYKIKPKKISTLIYGCILTVLLIAINSYWGFTSRLIDYWGDYQSVKYLVDARENDPNFVMGRISALYIVPEIIKDNTMLGVGLGNYSLVRNNPKYLGIFPSVEQWDLTGLGGIINLLVEVGILGLLFFLYPFFKMWKNTQHETVKLIIILFLLAQMCGVQLYFQYLWFAVGIMTAKNIREKNNSSRNLEINSDTENRCHYE